MCKNNNNKSGKKRKVREIEKNTLKKNSATVI